MQKKLWMRRLAAWLTSGSATVAASPARRNSARRKPRTLLALEMLEDRRLLAAGSLDLTFAGTGSATVNFGLGGNNNDQAAGSAIQLDGKVISVGSADGTQNVVRMTNFSSQGIGAFPTGIAVGDFNGDFKNDVATANYGGNTIGVLLGNGNGTLGAQSVIALPANTQPFAVKTGVFNSTNGFVDIVSANFNGQSVTYIAGNGNGTFQAPVQIAIAHKLVSVAVGDLNGDSKQDVVGSSGDGTLTVLLGNGNGTFKGTGAGGAIAPFSALTAIFDVAITRLNDTPGSQPALVVAAFAANKVGVLPGNGDGTFAAPIFTNTNGTVNEFVATGDFNRDGKADVATTNRDTNNISVLLGNGNGTFSSTTLFGTDGTKPLGIAATDINRDGNLDLVAANQGATSTTGSVAVFLGNGNGFLPANQFANAVTYSSGVFPFAIAAGEFNLTEGAPDVLVTNFDGVPVAAVTLATNNSAVGTADFALTRFNTDGSLDSTFGLGGKVNIGFNFNNGGTNEERAFSVGLDAGGKIIVAGYAQLNATDYAMAIARLNSNGTMDTTFGADHNGKVTVAFNVNTTVGGPEIALATSNTLAVQPSGAILVAGQVQTQGLNEATGTFLMAAARLTSSGFLDPTFGSGAGPAGTVVLDAFGLSGATAERDGADGIAVQSDGKIVLSGFAGGPNSHTNFIAAARLTAAGALDGSFNPNGAVRGEFAINLNLNPGGENDNQGTSVALQLDGKILVGGFAQTTNSTPNGAATGSFNFAAIRLTTVGELDTTFNFTGNGSVPGTVAFGFNLNAGGQNDDRANAISTQKNGTIVLAGYAQRTATAYDIAVARLQPNGTLDSQFGIVGSAAPATGNFPGQSHFPIASNVESIGLSLVIDNRQTANLDGTGDGLSNIIVSGYSTTATGNDFAIMRLSALNVIPISGDWTGKGFDSPGLYDPRASIFYLKNANDGGGADFVAQIVTINVGGNITNPAGFGWIPIVGDWTGQVNPSTGFRIDGVGLYDPAGSTFFLWNNAAINPPTTLSATPDISFTFGAGLTGLQPVSGNFVVQTPLVSSVGVWKPESTTGVTPASSRFILLPTPSQSATPIIVNYGPANDGVNPSPRTHPIMGDWTNKGFDSVGVWEPSVATSGASTYLLRNTNTSGNPDLTLGFGPVNGNGVVSNTVVGRWAANFTGGDGLATINPIATPKMTWSMTNQPGGTGTVPANFTFGDPLGGSPELVGGFGDAGDLTPLTLDDLSPIVANALTRFLDTGLTQDQVDLLGNASIVITDLGGWQVGFTRSDGTIYLDETAAGHGWFIDPTPGLDSEFQDGLALPGSDADGKVDLLTVVMHEFGHRLGLVDLDPWEHGDDLMSATLGLGTRRVDVLDALYAQVQGDVLHDEL